MLIEMDKLIKANKMIMKINIVKNIIVLLWTFVNYFSIHFYDIDKCKTIIAEDCIEFLWERNLTN